MKELFLVEPQERYKEEFEKMFEEYRALAVPAGVVIFSNKGSSNAL